MSDDEKDKFSEESMEINEAKTDEIMLNEVKNDPDFFYPTDYKEKIRVEHNIPVAVTSRFKNIGLPLQVRKNIFFLESDLIILCNSSTFDLVNLKDMSIKSFPGTDIKGIGCITVSSCKNYIAVGESGYFPNINIYKFNIDNKTISLYRILRKGTENVFSALAFNEDNSLFASAGSDPDHNLIVWNWKTESVILRAKAFSQEVYSLSFSDNFEGKLITSGMGHIKFWEMAKTFTGLKLQGELGKFGQIDLSDVTTYLEFPDGKILCGTEQGTLLLWEGIFVKSQIFMKESVPCHGEAILKSNSEEEINKPDKYINTFIEKMFWEGKNTIVTSGYDGLIKWWNFLDFENAEIDDFNRSYISPIKSYKITNETTKINSKIVNIITNYSNSNLIKYFNDESFNDDSFDPNNLFWLIQDINGHLYKAKITFENKISEIKSVEIIYSGFSQCICATSLNNSPFIIVQDTNSKIGMVDIMNKSISEKKEIFVLSKVKNLLVTTCELINPTPDSDELPIILSGFNTGLIRIHQMKNSKFELIFQTKVHENEVSFLKASPEDKSLLLSLSGNEIFIQLIQSWSNITPLFYFKKDGLECIDWLNSKSILVGLNDGSVEQIILDLTKNNSETFEIKDYEFKKMYMRNSYEFINQIEKNKKKKFKSTEEACKGKIYSIKFAGLQLEDDFFVTCCEPYEDFIFLCSFDIDKIPENECTITDNIYNNLRPINHWKMPKTKVVNSRVLGGRMPTGEEIKYIKNELSIKCYNKEFLIVANMNGSGIIQVHHKNNLALYVEIFLPLINNNLLKDIFLYQNYPIFNVIYSNGCVESFIIDTNSLIDYINWYEVNHNQKKRDMLSINEDFNEEEYHNNLEEFLKTQLYPVSSLNLSTLTEKLQNEFASESFKKYFDKLNGSGFDEIDGLDVKDINFFIEMRSIEMLRRDAELQDKLKKAEEKKSKLRDKINYLREDFKNIISKNESAPEEIKLLPEELIVDETFIESVQKVISENLADINHKYEWFKAIEHGTINRLENFFLKSVKTNFVKLYTLSREKESNFCTTIRCPALPENFDEILNNLELCIDEYKSKISFKALDEQYDKYLKNVDEAEVIKTEAIEEKINVINDRIADFEKKTDIKSKERVNFGKDLIKIELDHNINDFKDLDKFRTFYQKTKSSKSYKKNGTIKNLRCPKRYTLKINYDIFYTEELMKTSFEHKLSILKFVNLLYDVRVNYNKEFFELRDNKIKIIEELRLNKQKLIAINNELGIRTISNEDPKLGYENTGKYIFDSESPTENLDWLNVKMNDDEFDDNLIKIEPEELRTFTLEEAKKEGIPEISDNINENTNNINDNQKENYAFPYNNNNFNVEYSHVYNEIKLNFKDRGTKKVAESKLSQKMKEISSIKLNYKKKSIIEESKEMIENFDRDIRNQRKKKLDVHFKQKLGELELFIKHEEYNILRAFFTDDEIIVDELDKLSSNYKSNLLDLETIENSITTLEQQLKAKKNDRLEKIEVRCFLF